MRNEHKLKIAKKRKEQDGQKLLKQQHESEQETKEKQVAEDKRFDKLSKELKE